MDADRISATFDEVAAAFTAATKRGFLRDLRGQIDDDPAIEDILHKSRPAPRFYAVSFDRRKNDKSFSYSHADLLLVLLDALSGGIGIRKPVSQLRVLRWNGTRRDLLAVLRYFARLNPQIRFRRILVMTFPWPPVGWRIDYLPYNR